MRAVLAALVALLLVGCAGSSDDLDGTTTTVTTSAGLSSTSMPTSMPGDAPATTIPESGATTEASTSPEDRPDRGGEAITVTEKVTITVTDPEDP